jgi:hypothetical protein
MLKPLKIHQMHGSRSLRELLAGTGSKATHDHHIGTGKTYLFKTAHHARDGNWREYRSIYRLTDNRSFEGLDAGLSRDIHRQIEFLFSAAATQALLRSRRSCALSFRRSDSRWTVEFPKLVDPIHTLSIARLTSKRECTGLHILTVRCFAVLEVVMKDGDSFRNGNSFLTTRAEDTPIMASC